MDKPYLKLPELAKKINTTTELSDAVLRRLRIYFGVC
jgi:hypothetical protein